MRLAVLGFSHEANTFAPVPATLDQWRRAGILEGERIRDVYEASRTSVAGFLAYGAEAHGVELIPLVYARITPMGPSTSEAHEHLVTRMVASLVDRGPWDGVLLPIHGAAVAEGCPDADGDLIRRVRGIVGPDVPIGATLDLHANVSRTMVDHLDVVTVYQTNPHVDAYEQALACARLLGRTIRAEIRPRLALVTPPLAVTIVRQGTDDEPMASLLAVARSEEARPGVLSVSVVEGFPYADVPEMGMSFLAVADRDDAIARAAADRVARAAWEMRAEFVGEAVPVDEALFRAAAALAGPVVLLDIGDNVGGGSPGDSTHILHAARRLGVRGLAQLLTDPVAVSRCAEAGVGGRVSLDVGGRTDDRHGTPLAVTGVVTAVTDGRFEDPTPTHGGVRSYDMGPTAGLRTDDGFDLVLTSVAEATHSQEQFRLVGVEPRECPVIVAKGVHSPRAGFEPIAAELIQVATPGSTSADLSTFRYARRRRPMFPFEPTTQWSAR
ncbi:M81 family metallopeptidase [Actinopolymorpha pittospori]|uniref:Microcystin degradation protein MlrC n=1 Tax=Actinopolymorpha pittospori TaxID=648752 RepID=A0A927RDX3_9ACTN|nr:M81 family metallopeptidase [Actinopolymorpha pittospori]MBE1608595.1 microcystin degradation protein MlrC [Actinopolymorpha pittospori]